MSLCNVSVSSVISVSSFIILELRTSDDQYYDLPSAGINLYSPVNLFPKLKLLPKDVCLKANPVLISSEITEKLLLFSG